MLVSSTHYGNGYKTQDEPTIKFLEKMDELKIPVYTCHTSGHGSRDCIKQVIDITKPTTTICIHSEAPEKIKELTDTAISLQDMEIYEVK